MMFFKAKLFFERQELGSIDDKHIESHKSLSSNHHALHIRPFGQLVTSYHETVHPLYGPVD